MSETKTPLNIPVPIGDVSKPPFAVLPDPVVLFENRASLEPIADDVATLGLDMLVREAGYRRGAFNPYLLGY